MLRRICTIVLVLVVFASFAATPVVSEVRIGLPIVRGAPLPPVRPPDPDLPRLPTPTPVPETIPVIPAAVKICIADMASRLGVPEKQVSVVSFQVAEWRNSCMGCPQPGQVCLQRIISGWQIVLRGAGWEFEYHTDQTGLTLKLCRQDQIGFPDAVKASINDLSQRLRIPTDQITVVSFQVAEWRNSCLGCPQSGEVCLQKVLGGWQIILSAQQQQWEYHTDQEGRALRLCHPDFSPSNLSVCSQGELEFVPNPWDAQCWRGLWKFETTVSNLGNVPGKGQVRFGYHRYGGVATVPLEIAANSSVRVSKAVSCTLCTDMYVHAEAVSWNDGDSTNGETSVEKESIGSCH